MREYYVNLTFNIYTYYLLHVCFHSSESHTITICVEECRQFRVSCDSQQMLRMLRIISLILHQIIDFLPPCYHSFEKVLQPHEDVSTLIGDGVTIDEGSS